MIRRPPSSPLFPYPPLFRSGGDMLRDFSSFPRCDAGRQDCFEVLGTVAIGVSEIFVRHSAQLSAQFAGRADRSEEHTSELQSPCNLVCRLLLEKKTTRTSDATVGSAEWSSITRRSSRIS